MYAEIAHTLAQIHEEYWIPQGCVEVRRVLSQCLICCRLDGPSFQLPRMPPWSRERVSQSHLFQFVGLGYLGTVYVKVNSRASFRGWEPLSHFLDEGLHSDLHKIWIRLFTCLSVRAMHLEWEMNLTATQFLNCL